MDRDTWVWGMHTWDKGRETSVWGMDTWWQNWVRDKSLVRMEPKTSYRRTCV